MNNPSINIEVNNAPRDLVIGFDERLDKSIVLTINHSQENADHFEGPADIVIYINEHLTELIVNALIANAVWEGIKYGIESTWRKIVPSKKYKNKDTRRIEIKFKIDSNHTIEYELDGNVEANEINALTSKIIDYLKNKEQQVKDFNNPDFKDNDDRKPRIRIRYNSQSRGLGNCGL
jgi:hypothetical protein